MNNKKIIKFFNSLLKLTPSIVFLSFIIGVYILIVLPYGIYYLPQFDEYNNVWLMWLTICLVLLWTIISLIIIIYYFKVRQDILSFKLYKKTIEKSKKVQRHKEIREKKLEYKKTKKENKLQKKVAKKM